MKRLTFKEYYAVHFYQGEGGNWAGANGEVAIDVLQRLANALAAYADYVADRLES